MATPIEILTSVVDNLIWNLVLLSSESEIITQNNEWIKTALLNGFGATSFMIGAALSNTLLPDEDIEITQIIPKKQCFNWFAIANDSINAEIARSTQQMVGEIESIAIFPKKNRIKVNIFDYDFNLSPNNLSSLFLTAIIEEIDEEIIGNNHLFKRSLMLIKSWCFYESKRMKSNSK